jgi:dethiobiotin synthetase
MTQSLFVTAIGTDCGKTHVSAALLRELTRQGRDVVALKPLMSGFDPAALEGSDAGRLLAAMGRPAAQAAVDAMVWRRFPDWLAPNVAARRAGVSLAYDDLLAFVEQRRSPSGLTLIEGAGGVMSPLTDTHTNLDLMADLRAPALLLAASYLGAVSHTLTALDALRHRGLDVAAIVVTQPAPESGEPASFIDELARWTAIPLIAAPYAQTPDADRRFAAPLVARLYP